MFASGDFNNLLDQVLAQLGVDGKGAGQGQSCPGKNKDGPVSGKGTTGGNGNNGSTKGGSVNIPALAPSAALVIAGLLTGVLDVDSVLVDRNQNIEIVVVGSLRRKTPLDKMMDQIGPMSFDEVMQAISNRFK